MPTTPETAQFGRRSLLKGLFAVGVGGLAGTGAYGYVYERHNLEVTKISISPVGLPEALVGLRIGFMTDLHHSGTVPKSHIDAAVSLMMAEKPDLIVLGGDYVTWQDFQYLEGVADSLSRLTARYGVYAVLGNHDDDREVPAALSRSGIEVLVDVRTNLTISNESVELVGLRFWTRNATEIRRLINDATGYILMLAHDPRRITEASTFKVPLLLSGHTHGGQVVLPGLGAIAARKFPIASGLLNSQKTTLFVSRGVRTVVLPLRLNCPPEIAILTLESHSKI